MKKNKLKILIFTLIVAVALLAAGFFHIEKARIGSRREGTGTAATEQDALGSDTENTGETESDGGAGDADEARPVATVFFASDYQAEDGFDSPANTLRGILTAADADGKAIGRVVMCGDYTNDAKLHDYQLSPDESIEEIRAIVKELCPETGAGEGSIDEKTDGAGGGIEEAGAVDGSNGRVENAADTGADDAERVMFVQGNHDRLTDEITESGLHDCGEYLIYVLNTEEDFPWKQGKTMGCLAKVKKSSAAMKECFSELIEKGEKRPVFIAGHVPLHFTARTSSRHSTGDNLYSSLIFNVVNDAAKDLDIVYLFGHNHSKGWDCYMGGGCVFKSAGETLLLPVFNEQKVNTDEYVEKKLNFTYMNAGYTGYYMNCGPAEQPSDYRAADETLTGTVIEVYADRLEITRYDINGVHDLGSAGEADPYKGGIDDGLIGPDKYSLLRESPQVVERMAHN